MQTLYDYDGNILDIGSSGQSVDVTGLGVDNTGSADASERINEIIANGGHFYFPPGTYLLENQLVVHSNTVIEGSGRDTLFTASPSLSAVYHTICNNNASDIDARCCMNEDVDDGHPHVSEYITSYDENIVLRDFSVNGNWPNRDLVNWPKKYTGKGVEIGREPGTNIEIQAAHDVIIENVYAYNGIQHNFNIRAGSGSYQMGVTYAAEMQSYRCVIRDCVAENERYDDCFTTHDSNNILIDNCACYMTNNVNGVYASGSVSNGFEIDDGSSFITVRNCKSYYSQCGFQAKGHEGTPPAHDVIFDGCVAFYNQCPFSLGCGPASEYDTYKTIYGRCKNIRIVNCSIIKPYPFSNITSWQGTLQLMDLKGCCDVIIENLYIENTGAPDGVQNDYGQPLRTIFYMREHAHNITFKNVRITSPISNENQWGQGLFHVLAGCSNLFMKDIFLGGVSGSPIINFVPNGTNDILSIDGIYVTRLTENDQILKIADTTDESQVNVLGERKNMYFIS